MSVKDTESDDEDDEIKCFQHENKEGEDELVFYNPKNADEWLQIPEEIYIQNV